MVKRHHKTNGKYHIHGHAFENLKGSRAQVMHGTAYKTPGGLTKNDLMKNRWGRIVSKKKHDQGKRNNNLLKYGWTAKKGKFGAVRVSASKKKAATMGGRKRRGGRSARRTLRR